ncbi:hypothetical protein XENOCAPTIV_014528 [Xenoophorus captivus]|uniref:Uncharacterized protein n=1 Tax=Xenoophorus captivus TaxID=1517983 RepID=A0ABV0RA22_9TELE
MRSAMLAPLLLYLLLAAGSDVMGEVVDKNPNFVFMMVDDLGIGDIGLPQLSQSGVRGRAGGRSEYPVSSEPCSCHALNYIWNWPGDPF